MKEKKRLDLIIADRYPNLTRTQIQSFIMQGKISVSDKIVTKPGTIIDVLSKIDLSIDEPKYVCRAGWKLEKALDVFAVDPTGLVILDAGLSTGGFTDCLLQRGASKVFGVDVGTAQVHEKISRNPKVVVMEQTNLRYISDDNLGEKVDLVTLDLSFISVLKVMEAVKAVLKPNGSLIVLIKPQFEAGKNEVERGGLITNPVVHERVIKEVSEGICSHGFEFLQVIESPIYGTQGNKEFLAYFKNSKI